MVKLGHINAMPKMYVSGNPFLPHPGWGGGGLEVAGRCVKEKNIFKVEIKVEIEKVSSIFSSLSKLSIKCNF